MKQQPAARPAPASPATLPMHLASTRPIEVWCKAEAWMTDVSVNVLVVSPYWTARFLNAGSCTSDITSTQGGSRDAAQARIVIFEAAEFNIRTSARDGASSWQPGSAVRSDDGVQTRERCRRYPFQADRRGRETPDFDNRRCARVDARRECTGVIEMSSWRAD